MRYHHTRSAKYFTKYGEIYECNHPVYNRCTLFKIGNKGIAVIQQRFDREFKTTYWDSLDYWIANDIYLHPNFKEFFDNRSGYCTDDGLYPTISVRQIMWALKMKPLEKARWETCFDRKEI